MLQIFAADAKGERFEITDLYWFEEQGVNDWFDSHYKFEVYAHEKRVFSTQEPEPVTDHSSELAPYLTPQEYLSAVDQLQKQIDKLNAQLAECHQFTVRCPIPDKLRPAKPKDIVVGAIIWSKSGGDFEIPGWHRVDRVLNPTDEWKGYISNGARRGLYGAFVEVKT